MGVEKECCENRHIHMITCRDNDNRAIHFSPLPCMYTYYPSFLLFPFCFCRVCASHREVIKYFSLWGKEYKDEIVTGLEKMNIP